MATQVLKDPRGYLPAVLVVALTVLVPMTFGFVTLMDTVFGPDSGILVTILWVLLGVAVAGLAYGLIVILARATRQSDLEHEAQHERDIHMS